jgi:hypothetical protein
MLYQKLKAFAKQNQLTSDAYFSEREMMERYLRALNA